MICDYENACNYFEKALVFPLDYELAYVQALIISYGYCLISTQQYTKALQLSKFYPFLSSSADFVYLMGLIYFENKQYENALDEFEKAMTFDYAARSGSNTYLPAFYIGQILLLIGETETAKKYFSLCGDYTPAKEALSKIL